MENAYSAITDLIHLGVWETKVMPLAAKHYTLDRYYKIYRFILEHEPQKKYGYIPRILNNKTFRERFGNQYDEPAIRKIIHVMEKPFPK